MDGCGLCERMDVKRHLLGAGAIKAGAGRTCDQHGRQARYLSGLVAGDKVALLRFCHIAVDQRQKALNGCQTYLDGQAQFRQAGLQGQQRTIDRMSLGYAGVNQ